MTKTPVVFEMETGDPDDFLALLWLADHPDLNLVGVAVTPGGEDQCALARYGLGLCGSNAYVASTSGIASLSNKDSFTGGDKQRVSAWHYSAFPEAPKTCAVAPMTISSMMSVIWTQYGQATYLTGCAPKGLSMAMRQSTAPLVRTWIMQGGFAGDNLVPAEKRLPKFDGRLTCPSFNPNGAPAQTLDLLADPRIAEKRLVSKNVCHGVVWDDAMSAEFWGTWAWGHRGPRVGIAAMGCGLENLRKQGRAKAMHDIVAAAVVADRSVCDFAPCEVYRSRGEWGATASENTTTSISVGFNRKRFLEVLAR